MKTLEFFKVFINVISFGMGFEGGEANPVMWLWSPIWQNKTGFDFQGLSRACMIEFFLEYLFGEPC